MSLATARVNETFTRILALDLGKFNRVACNCDVRMQQHRFRSIATSPQTIHDLLVEHAGSEPSGRPSRQARAL